MKRVKNQKGIAALDRNYLEAGDVIKVRIADTIGEGTITNLSVPTIVVDEKEYVGNIFEQYGKKYLYDATQNVTVWIEENISAFKVEWHRASYNKEGLVSGDGNRRLYLDYELAKADYLAFWRSFNFRAEAINHYSNGKGEVVEEKVKNIFEEENRKVTLRESIDKKVRIEESVTLEW